MRWQVIVFGRAAAIAWRLFPARRAAVPVLVVGGVCVLALSGATAQTTAAAGTPVVAAPATTLALLDRYARGEFDEVTSALSDMNTFNGVLTDLETDAASWMAAGGKADRPRRELAAATFALEAARAGEWTNWKTIQIVEVTVPSKFDTKYHMTRWDAPALLLEWGCALLRDARNAPTEQEHLWQLAAMAVAERAEDFEFLVGSQAATPPGDGPVIDVKVIEHAKHALDRFPREQRFQLAYGIANEWVDPPTASAAFKALEDDVDSGAEATMRLGAMALRSGDAEGALKRLDRVEALTRDPWIIYLAHYFAGQASERLDRSADAARHYRRALAAMPRAQAASVALASVLFRTGARAEASSLVEAMADADPVATDPWRGYADADDRFWPVLISAIRREIAP